MHKRKPALSKGGGTTKLSETLKIQAVGAGFLAKSNLCSSEAELVGGIDRRKLSKSKLTRVNPLSHGVPPCQLPLLMGASRLCTNMFLCSSQNACAFDGWKVSFAQEQSFSLAFGNPAPFTQGSLTFVHQPSFILSFKSSSRMAKQKMSAAQG